MSTSEMSLETRLLSSIWGLKKKFQCFLTPYVLPRSTCSKGLEMLDNKAPSSGPTMYISIIKLFRSFTVKEAV
jgi:hypothetical protein